MTEIFDIELLNYDPNTPVFYVMLISAIMAFFLSSLLAITYEFTTKSIYRKAHFLQAMALIGIVAATVMQAIGESVAIGLGILGALSIIRFRTQLDDPRNITFMFASLAAGIACGVLGYKIALTGTLVFCFAAVVLKYSHFGQVDELVGEIRLLIPGTESARNEIERILKEYCKNYELDQWRIQATEVSQSNSAEEVPEAMKRHKRELFYLVRLKNKAKIEDMEAELLKINELSLNRLNFRKDPLIL